MKRSRLFIALSLFFVHIAIATSEERKIYIFPPLGGRGAGPSTVIDTSTVQVYYAFCASDLHDMDTYRDFFCLEVGKRNVKFYSHFLEEAESAVRNWHNTNRNAGAAPRISPKGRYQNGWSEYQYGQWFISNGTITEYCCFPQWLTRYNSYYEDIYPNQSWEIHKDTLSLCGYTCQKAVCHFHGNFFIAWFAPQIPLGYGPWKLGGLPGLILKATDKDELYSFECVRIERKRKPMLKDAYKSYHKLGREKILKLQKGINEDIGNFLKYTNPETGEPLHFYRPYTPLELK